MSHESRSPSHTNTSVIVAAMLVVISAANAHAQNKVVQRSRVYPNSPVELVNLKSKEQPLRFGKSYEGEIGWLKDLAFSVENISRKNIVFISLAVDFTEVKIPNIFRHYIYLGRPTNTDCCKHLPPLVLNPGDTLSVSLLREYEKFGETVDKHYGADVLSTITVVLGQVHFEDSTMWDFGEIYRPDAERPGKWARIE